VITEAKHGYDESKLPKWAQNELYRLRRDLERAVEAAMDGPEDSDTFVDPYFNYAPDASEHGRPLGKGNTVRLRIGEGRQHYLDVRVRHDHVELHGGETIASVPRGANGARIYVNREFWT
jgi:hypothetical protein